MSREIHIHVEESSMEAYLKELLPRLTNVMDSIRIINHSEKQKLLREIPARLRGYARIPGHIRPLVLVLVDRDNDDCHVLKQTLEDSASAAALVSKSTVGVGPFEVVNRIVIEELEAWHFGDIPSLIAEFPGVPATLARRVQFRDPDAIAGGTHEALLRILQGAGHYRYMPALPKVETARRLARRNDIDNNRSASFQMFRSGLNALVAQLTEFQDHG